MADVWLRYIPVSIRARLRPSCKEVSRTGSVSHVILNATRSKRCDTNDGKESEVTGARMAPSPDHQRIKVAASATFNSGKPVIESSQVHRIDTISELPSAKEDCIASKSGHPSDVGADIGRLYTLQPATSSRNRFC